MSQSLGRYQNTISGRYNTMLAKCYRNSKVNVIVSLLEVLAKCYRNSKVNVIVSLLEVLNCRVRDSDSGILKSLL